LVDAPAVDVTAPTGDGTVPMGDAAATTGGAPVDAGYYFGDGSYWVDGGAYSELPDAAGQQVDAEVVDAAPGCASLAACCPTLAASSQSLCDLAVASGDATTCAAELSQLQAEGECAGSGVTVLAAQLQAPANRMVSDGTTLFWTTAATPGLLAMPVQGGPITILLGGLIANEGGTLGESGDTFLAVDDVNVYVLENNGIVRIPKAGGPATLVNESGAIVVAATSLGGTAYWVENPGGPTGNGPFPVRSGLLQGGPITLLNTSAYTEDYSTNQIAVTADTVFVGSTSSQLFYFPLAGQPTGSVELVPNGAACTFLASDTDAIYCSSNSVSNLAIASDQAVMALGSAYDSSYVVFDDTSAYWADMTTVGTIVEAPKAGGGNASILARDANPTAIAVDARSVYWSDAAGYIKSIPK
jgi:hypothetical protein